MVPKSTYHIERAACELSFRVVEPPADVAVGSKAEVTPLNSDVCLTSPKRTWPDAMSWLAASAALYLGHA